MQNPSIAVWNKSLILSFDFDLHYLLKDKVIMSWNGYIFPCQSSTPHTLRRALHHGGEPHWGHEHSPDKLESILTTDVILLNVNILTDAMHTFPSGRCSIRVQPALICSSHWHPTSSGTRSVGWWIVSTCQARCSLLDRWPRLRNVIVLIGYLLSIIFSLRNVS